jgi:hypothetical protein
MSKWLISYSLLDEFNDRPLFKKYESTSLAIYVVSDRLLDLSNDLLSEKLIF